MTTLYEMQMNPTDPFTTLELQNPSRDASEEK